MNYILASASPRRRELLLLAGLDFTICAAAADETPEPALSPGEAAQAIAARKAAAVADLLCPADDTVIIAADTVVSLDGALFGKPRDDGDAARMLRALSGREHSVFTGVCLRRGERGCGFYQETRVRFYALTDGEIAAYIRSGEPRDKAGAYGIQGRGALLAEGITGDYCNVVGLPLARLIRTLRTMEAEPWT
ncbi:MAG: Maf family protein [Oscillospiraceae bacterium]|jgi:septum formation protein|nr:Maf family protein [Oscillospiraceae bacterium]